MLEPPQIYHEARCVLLPRSGVRVSQGHRVGSGAPAARYFRRPGRFLWRRARVGRTTSQLRQQTRVVLAATRAELAGWRRSEGAADSRAAVAGPRGG